MPAVQVYYCAECGLPPEYCMFNSGTQYEKCKKSLLSNADDLYRALYPEETVSSSSSSDKANPVENPLESKAQPISKNNNTNNNKKQKNRKVTLKKTDRNKKKSVTTVTGLELFSVDLKKAAKLFAGKFACGSSVTTSNQGIDEIVIQGDVIDQLPKLLSEQFSISEASIEVTVSAKEKK